MTTKYHFLGIGGIGMSGLARILIGKNTEVSGSDQVSSDVTEGLQKIGAQVFIGHDARYVTAEKTVVYTSGIKHDNPEYQEARLILKQEKLRSTFLFQKMHGMTCPRQITSSQSF